MKEGTEKRVEWKGLPFYTRVTIGRLLVFALIHTSVNGLFMVGAVRK